MIIDRICDRRDGVAYNPRDFYYYLMEAEANDYYSQRISAALDGGENSDVQNALCEYIRDNGYALELCGYVYKKDWINSDEIFRHIDILLSKYEQQVINLSTMIYNGDNWGYNLNAAICEFAEVLKASDKHFADVELHEIGVAINEAICAL